MVFVVIVVGELIILSGFPIFDGPVERVIVAFQTTASA